MRCLICRKELRSNEEIRQACNICLDIGKGEEGKAAESDRRWAIERLTLIDLKLDQMKAKHLQSNNEIRRLEDSKWKLLQQLRNQDENPGGKRR